MRVKLDENLPHRAEAVLTEQGHDVTTVVQEGLGGKNDPTIARAAAREERAIITLDRRFVDIRRYPPGQHPGFIVLRLADQSSIQVERLLLAFLDQYQLDELAGCVVVIEPGHVRIRRPR